MDAWYLPNRVRVDIEAVVDAILATEDYPQQYLDIKTGTLVAVSSVKGLHDWVIKIGNSKQYFLVEHLNDEYRDQIARDFIADILSVMASGDEARGAVKALSSGNWRAMERHLKENTDGWVHGWHQYLADEAGQIAEEWLSGSPHFSVTSEFEGCGGCAMCELIRKGEGGDATKLAQAFATEETMRHVEEQLEQRRKSMAPQTDVACAKPAKHIAGNNILQLKIELSGSKPLVWRRIIVPEEYSFFDLHIAIQDAMGWFGYDLHEFFDRSPYTSRDATSIKIPHPDDEIFSDKASLDERNTGISDFLKKEKDAVWYMYDFGDGWGHKITLEKILPRTAGMKVPDILAGKNRCPYEDSGALFGYYEKMDILKDKKHPEYEEILWWAAEQAGYGPDEVDDTVRKELSDVTRFDINEVEWSDPREELELYEQLC